MRIVFRTDASLEIGTGHVMRCITLADNLKKNGAECHFICREHDGNLINFIYAKGYAVHVLPFAFIAENEQFIRNTPQLTHATWLGVSQQQDAEQCSTILVNLQPDWLIVDHYALDINWESLLRPYYQRLMVIDDLADRNHRCDLLLDQTFGRDTADYLHRVPKDCMLLCGSKYALLRPEFSALRPYSIQRRKKIQQLDHLLITMGGVDKDNATAQVLKGLRVCKLPEHCRITVVMGATAPWLDNVRKLATDMPWPTAVKVNVSDMAQLMADSDLAIGAAGATSWERCCLGLPTLMLILADNQRQIAINLEQSKAAKIISNDQSILVCLPQLLNPLIASALQLNLMSEAATTILDGHGTAAVVHYLES